MEISITTNQTLKVLQVISWIIFIGLCIEAGGTTVNTVITLFINPRGVKKFWEDRIIYLAFERLTTDIFLSLRLQ